MYEFIIIGLESLIIVLAFSLDYLPRIIRFLRPHCCKKKVTEDCQRVS